MFVVLGKPGARRGPTPPDGARRARPPRARPAARGCRIAAHAEAHSGTRWLLAQSRDTGH